MSTGIMKTHLHYPALMEEMMNGMRRGMDMGDGLKRPLFMTDWRSYLAWPIKEIRKDLNILDAPPPGHWEWTNAAWEG
jgi:ubiquinone biosynthesis protein Coq4